MMSTAIVAKRRFLVTSSTGEETEARLEFGIPYSFSSTGEDFRCEFRVIGIGDEKTRYGDGVDSLQALQLAMNIASAYLEGLVHSQKLNIRWEAGKPGELGLPILEF